MKLAVFALTKNGIKLGEGLARKLDAKFIHKKDFRQSVKNAFKKYDGLIFIMAAGIVVRTIAPFLKNKSLDPAIVVIDERGRHVISLLSGHLGGANILTRKIAKIIGAKPVITTATDVNDLKCLEEIAEKFNLVISDVKKIKAINSAIVNGKKVAFVNNNTKRLNALERFAGKRFGFYKTLLNSKKVNADALVIITNNILTSLPHPAPHILLYPRDIVAGIGCDRGVSMKDIEKAYLKVLKKYNISPLCVRNLASIDVKKDEKGLLRFAKRYNLKIDFYSRDELKNMPLPSGSSKFVLEKVGVGGVCEPSALKSAGTRKILVKKQKIGRVTIAISQAPFMKQG